MLLIYFCAPLPKPRMSGCRYAGAIFLQIPPEWLLFRDNKGILVGKISPTIWEEIQEKNFGKKFRKEGTSHGQTKSDPDDRLI